MRSLWLLALSTVLGCSNEIGTTASNALLLTGLEADPWSETPAPTEVKIDLVSGDQRVTIGQSKAPFAAISIRDPGLPSGSVGTFEASGIDEGGNSVVRGTTVPFLLYGITGVSIPIFVGRSSSWSRPPDTLQYARGHAVTTTAYHQFLIAAGGEVAADFDPSTPDIYDFANWEALRNQPRFPRAPKSMLVVGSTLFCIDDLGATWLDLSDDRVAVAPVPAGLTSYAEIAGGEVWQLDDGARYVVGATRPTGEPTNKVLRINKDGLVSAISLNTPRVGAAAGVVGGNLVVWGGSGAGAGAEILNKTFDGFAPLPFPADPTRGLGLVALDATTALLAGGSDPATSKVRTFDTSCSADCLPADVTTLPLGIERTKIFTLAPGTVLVTGESADAEFHSYSLVLANGSGEITERPLRQRRRNASALLLPNAQPGVMGGQDPDSGTAILSIEAFIP